MPTFRHWTNHSNWSRPSPWHARAKRDNLEFSLGYYHTYTEAKDIEDYFALWIPRITRTRHPRKYRPNRNHKLEYQRRKELRASTT